MICAACNGDLSPLVVRGVTVDVCRDGCAGIWFDNFELKKFDEAHEAATELLDLTPVRPAAVDRVLKRRCPRCENSVLRRNFFSFKRQFEIDVCPNCGGCWLDAGELGLVRSEFPTEAEKRKATQRFVTQEFGAQWHQIKADSENQVSSARAIASVFRAVGTSIEL